MGVNVEFRQNSEFDPPWHNWNKPVLLVLFIYPACDGHEKVYMQCIVVQHILHRNRFTSAYTHLEPTKPYTLFEVSGTTMWCVCTMIHFLPPSTVEFELSEVVECLWGNFIESFTIRQRHHKSESKLGLKPRRFLEKFSPRYFCKVQLWKWSKDKFIFISVFLCVFQTPSTPLHLRISNWREQKNYTLATKCLETPPRPWKSSQRSRDLWKMSSSSSTSSRRQRQVNEVIMIFIPRQSVTYSTHI